MHTRLTVNLKSFNEKDFNFVTLDTAGITQWVQKRDYALDDEGDQGLIPDRGENFYTSADSIYFTLLLTASILLFSIQHPFYSFSDSIHLTLLERASILHFSRQHPYLLYATVMHSRCAKTCNQLHEIKELLVDILDW